MFVFFMGVGLGECCFSVDGTEVSLHTDMHLVFIQIREVLSFLLWGERAAEGVVSLL